MTLRALSLGIALLLAAPRAEADDLYPPVSSAWNCQARFNVLAHAPLIVPMHPASGEAEIVETAAALKLPIAFVENVYSEPNNLTKAQKAAREELKKLEAVPVSDIFPESLTRNGKTRVSMGPANRKAMREYFGKLWNARVKGGVIPKLEVKKYREWLRRQSPDLLGYPEIDGVQLYTDYVQAGIPISRYFDDKFLDFIEKDHGLTHEALPDYLNTLEPEYRKYWARVRMRDFRRITGGLKTSMIAAPVSALSFALVGTWSGWFKSGLDNVRAAAWNGVQQGEDLLNRAISAQNLQDNTDKLVIASQELAQAKMGPGVGRNIEVAAIRTTQAGLAALVPASYNQVISSQPNFSTQWQARLDKDYLPLTAWQSTYSQLSQSKAELQSRLDHQARLGLVVSDTDLRRMAEVTSQMGSFEDQMANVLADYAFYRSFKAKDPVPDLVREYDPVLSFYLNVMDVSKLRDRLTSRIYDHASLLKSLIPPFTESEKSQISKTLDAKKQADKMAADFAHQQEIDAETKARQVIEAKQATANAEANKEKSQASQPVRAPASPQAAPAPAPAPAAPLTPTSGTP